MYLYWKWFISLVFWDAIYNSVHSW